MCVRGHSRSFKPVPFESSGAVSHSPSMASFARKSDILVENCDFFHTCLAFDAPAHGVHVEILPSRLVRKN